MVGKRIHQYCERLAIGLPKRGLFFNVNYLDDEIFTYLTHPDHTGFDLITLIGLEYVLDQQAISNLVPLLSNVLNPKGMVVQSYLHTESSLNAVWTQSNFEQIPESYR
jgi:hypothetical protein